MTSILQAGAVALLAVGTGAAAASVIETEIPDFAVPDRPWTPGKALDGSVFRTVDTIFETGDVLKDELHFVDGRFQSAMCQEYCDFGWSEYRTWLEGEVIHFTATATCPDAPHTVVWYGTVVDDSLSFKGTWTTRRWYWTRQLNVAGEGSLAAVSSEASAG